MDYESVELLTPIAKQGECYYNLEKFHQQYTIHLKEKTKQAVLDAIKELEKLNYVCAACPGYIWHMDFENETTEGVEEMPARSITAVGIQSGRIPNDSELEKQTAVDQMYLPAAWQITENFKKTALQCGFFF